MGILEILEGSEKGIRENIHLLAKDYQEKTKRNVCLSCPSDVQYMILTLKNLYHMTQFAFKGASKIYKNKRGDKTTISNGTMTDKKAIEFLKTDPKRIRLFSTFPSNWKELIEGKKETEEEKNQRLAVEAEAQALKDSKEPEGGIVPEGNKKPLSEELLNMSLKELRATYPEVKATSIAKFVEKVLAL